MRGVSNDKSAAGQEGGGVMFPGAAQGVRAEFIAVRAVIGKRAKGKIVPDLVVRELALSTRRTLPVSRPWAMVG